MNVVCQSCGMPMRPESPRGSNRDGRPVVDYCVHCFRDGRFTHDVGMEQMIRMCAEHVPGDKRYYIANMRALYPHLKRWAKKEDTGNEHYRSIIRVLDYVKEHLHEPADLRTLAAVACISPYHFHRIFRQVIGEPLGEYVNRMRMEYVAGQLKTSGLSLDELARRSGYSGQQALSRAFKNYFGLPPKTFRATYFRRTFRGELSPRICRVAARNVVMLRYHLPDPAREWQKLYIYAMSRRILAESTVSVEVIDGGRYLPAITTAEPTRGDIHAASAVLREGLYAIFTHKGHADGVPALYAAARNYWLPRSRHSAADAPAYVVWLTSASMVAPGEQLSEIYMPLDEK